MKLTAIVEQGENGWLVGQIEELPSVISQGKTMSDLKQNLYDALMLMLETQKQQTEEEYKGRHFTREELNWA